MSPSCIDCGLLLEGNEDKFYKSKQNLSGYSGQCKACRASRGKAYRIEKFGEPKQTSFPYCVTCKLPIEGNEDQFYKNKKNKTGYTGECKTCRAVQNKQWRTDNKDKERDIGYRKHYGITLDQYNEMLRRQNHRCLICGTDKPGGHGKRLQIDHCHETGQIRGLLCNQCNLMLGNAKDKISVLESAIAYLERFQ